MCVSALIPPPHPPSRPAAHLPASLAVCGRPCPDDPTRSDVSVDRRAKWGHETLDKGHACPLAGKSSMHSFPVIVLQPGVQISLVQVELFPPSTLPTSLLLTFLFPFDSTSLCSPLFLLTSHSLTTSHFLAHISVSLMITVESRRQDKNSVAIATAKMT